MKHIGKVTELQIKDNGLIAKVSLENTLKNEIMFNMFQLEDKIFFIEFKRIRILEMIKELEDKNSPMLIEALNFVINKMDKEIHDLRKSISNLSKII